MVNVVVRLQVAPGKMRQALEWVQKMRTYSEDAGLFNTPSNLLRPITGESVHELVQTRMFPTMAEFEESYRKQRADTGCVALLSEMGESDWYLGNTRQVYDVIE